RQQVCLAFPPRHPARLSDLTITAGFVSYRRKACFCNNCHDHFRRTLFSAIPTIESVTLPSTASNTMASSSRSTPPLFRESVRRNPKPTEEAISSAATKNNHDWARAKRRHEINGGVAAGSKTVRKRFSPFNPYALPTSMSCLSTWRRAEAKVV